VPDARAIAFATPKPRPRSLPRGRPAIKSPVRERLGLRPLRGPPQEVRLVPIWVKASSGTENAFPQSAEFHFHRMGTWLALPQQDLG
jgi:hypothetical protein